MPDTIPTRKLLRLSKAFLDNDRNYSRMHTLVGHILDKKVGFSITSHNVIPLMRTGIFVYVQSSLFTSVEVIQATMDAIKQKAGITCKDPDPEKRWFKLFLTSIPIEVARPYMSTKATDDAERFSGGGADKSDQAASHTMGSTASDNGALRISDFESSTDASSSDTHGLVMALAKEHNLKGPGFPGRQPTGVAVYANIVISASKLDLARQVYKDAGLEWRESAKKGADDLIFRFFTGDWPEEKGKKKRRKDTTRAEEPPSTGTRTSTTGTQELLTQNDQTMIADSLKKQLLELIDEHKLRGTGPTGRPPTKVNTFLNVLILRRKLDEARTVFKKARVQWKEFEKKTGSKKCLIFRFYTGEWSDKEGAQTAGRGERNETTKRPASRTGRKKAAEGSNALESLRHTYIQLGERIDELDMNPGGKPDAEELATQVMKILKDAGYACIPEGEPLRFATAKRGAPTMVFNVDNEKLKSALVSGFEAED